MDDRVIKRLAYDGDYQRAIDMLSDIIVSMEKTINNQSKVIQAQEVRIQRLEKANKITQEILVNPILTEDAEELSLSSILQKSYESQER